jgi:hypothetical protein
LGDGYELVCTSAGVFHVSGPWQETGYRRPVKTSSGEIMVDGPGQIWLDLNESKDGRRLKDFYNSDALLIIRTVPSAKQEKDKQEKPSESTECFFVVRKKAHEVAGPLGKREYLQELEKCGTSEEQIKWAEPKNPHVVLENLQRCVVLLVFPLLLLFSALKRFYYVMLPLAILFLWWRRRRGKQGSAPLTE